MTQHLRARAKPGGREEDAADSKKDEEDKYHGKSKKPSSSPQAISFQHNKRISLVLLPLLAIVGWNTTFYIRVFALAGFLITFVLDLLQISREAPLISIGTFLTLTSLLLWQKFLFANMGVYFSGWNFLLAHHFSLVLFLTSVFAVLQFPWLWNELPQYTRFMERLLFTLLPITAYMLVIWQCTEAFPRLSLPVFALAQCLTFLVYFFIGTPVEVMRSECVGQSRSARVLPIAGFEHIVNQMLITLLVPLLYACNGGVFTNPLVFLSSNGGALQVAFLLTLPFFFKYQVLPSSSSSSSRLDQVGAISCLVLALGVEPNQSLALLALVNVGANPHSVLHWLSSLATGSFCIVAMQVEDDASRSIAFAKLALSYALAILAWRQQSGAGNATSKRWLLLALLSMGAVLWQVSHSWQVLVTAFSLCVAAIAGDKVNPSASALAFAIWAERGLVPAQYHFAYFVASSLVLYLCVAAVLGAMAHSWMEPLQEFFNSAKTAPAALPRLAAKFLLTCAFVRLLFALPAPVVVLATLALIVVSWEDYLIGILLAEFALCCVLVLLESNGTKYLIFPLLIFASMASLQIAWQASVGGGELELLPKQHRPQPLRLYIAFLLSLPLLFLCSAPSLFANQVQAVLGLSLALLGALASSLDALPDWILLAIACALGFAMHPPMLAMVQALALYFAMVSTRRRVAIALGISIFVGLMEDGFTLHFAVYCFALLCATSFYCKDRAKRLQALAFASDAEMDSANIFSLLLCVLVICVAWTHDFNAASLLFYCAALPFELKTRLVLAIQVFLLLRPGSSALVQAPVLLLFLFITELVPLGRPYRRLAFLSPLLGVLLFLHPSLWLSTCTLLASMGFTWYVDTPTLVQVAARVEQSL